LNVGASSAFTGTAGCAIATMSGFADSGAAITGSSTGWASAEASASESMGSSSDSGGRNVAARCGRCGRGGRGFATGAGAGAGLLTGPTSRVAE
jgi:hypothetical protein